MTKAVDLAKTGSLVNSSGQIDLTTGVTGVLPVANGGTGSSSGVSPGGSTTQVQYNNAGAFGGSANFVFDGTKVGIGTSSPSTTLHVTNADLTSALLVGSQSDSATWGGFFVNGATSSTGGAGMYGKAGANLYFNSATGYGHVWTINGAERMRIDSSGNVGIGTTTPTAFAGFAPILDLKGTAPAVVFHDTTASAINFTIAVNGNQMDFYNDSTSTSLMTLLSSGNVQLSSAGTSILNSSGRKILNQTGSVLQVIQTVKTDTFSTTSQQPTYADVTGMSVSITPSSSSSKILVFASFQMQTDQATNYAVARLVRDSTAIFVGDANGSNARASGAIALSQTYSAAGVSITYLDSPATTSAVTYKIQMAKGEGSATAYMNRGGDGDTGTNRARTPSSITVMEIAG